MGPPSHMWSNIDQNIVMQCITLRKSNKLNTVGQHMYTDHQTAEYTFFSSVQWNILQDRPYILTQTSQQILRLKS